MTPSPPEPFLPDHVPLFGTWGRIYTAVIAVTLLVMGALALFSSWNF
ncbi:MAG TPA: hypothetical protein VN083_08690 [Vicinamibacteria bacterium]|jgi:hypothetical protein|nr:hypothetical protein [Vicinamibacteria bacterium]